MGRPATLRQPADALDEIICYLVDTPDGPVGVLSDVERDEHGRAATLVIGQGWFGRRRLQIPTKAITQVDHRAGRIVLASGTAPLEGRSVWQRFAQLIWGRHSLGAPPAVPSDDPRRPVLCGIGEVAHAEPVLAAAVWLAERLDAALVIARVTPSSSRLVPPAAVGQIHHPYEETASEADMVINLLLSNAATQRGIRGVIAHGDPGMTLEALAARENADLIVIGSSDILSGATPFGGSLSRHLGGDAPCPVVVVPSAIGSSNTI